GSLRQIGDGVELQLDVVELLAGLTDALDERDVDGRAAGARVRCDLADLAVPGHLLFDPAGDQLLDLFRRGAGPRAQDESLTNRDVGILALWHVEGAVDAPQDRAEH